jgi:hypothetical protein
MDKKIPCYKYSAYLIIMASDAARVIEYRPVLKLFIISIFQDIQEKKFSGKMECPNSLAAVRYCEHNFSEPVSRLP